MTDDLKDILLTMTEYTHKIDIMLTSLLTVLANKGIINMHDISYIKHNMEDKK